MARERLDVPISEFKARERELLALQKKKVPAHNCEDYVEYVETDGALGQAYYCARCGDLLQVG